MFPNIILCIMYYVIKLYYLMNVRKLPINKFDV